MPNARATLPLVTNAAVRHPLARSISARVRLSSGSASRRPLTPWVRGQTPVMIEAMDGLVQGDCATARSKRAPRRAKASRCGETGWS